MGTENVFAPFIPWVAGGLIVGVVCICAAIAVYTYGDNWGAIGGFLLLFFIVGAVLSFVVALGAIVIPVIMTIWEGIKGLGPVQVEVHVK